MPETETPTYATRITGLLDVQGKTQEWLAAELGIQRATLTSYLTGRRAMLPGMLRSAAKALGVPAAYLEQVQSAQGDSGR